MSKEAEKLAERLRDIVTKYRFVSHEHGVIDGAASILRSQAEQIKVLREALECAEDALTVTLAPCGEWPAAIKSTQREALKNIHAALSNTKEE